MPVATFVVAIGLCLCLLCLPAIAAAAEPEAPILAEVDVDWDEPNLSIPLRVMLPFRRGADVYRFGLSSNGPTSFGKQFADILARPAPEIDFFGDFGDFGMRTAPRAWLGALPVRFPGGVVACELGGFMNERLVPNDGEVGFLDVFGQHIVQIDFDAGKMRFLRTLPELPGERFDILSLRQKPRLWAITVKAQCGSERVGEYFVELERPDAIYISPAMALRLAEKGDLRALHNESRFPRNWWMFGSQERPNHVGSATFTLGRFRTENVRTVVPGHNAIGRGYLSRFLVTFDFPNAAMYLLPGKQFERRDEFDVSGLVGRMTDEGLEVGELRVGTPAHKSGLEPLDVIVDVDGHAVNRETERWFRERIRQQGSTLRVRFLRAHAEEQTVDLVLPPPGHGEDAVAAQIPAGSASLNYSRTPSELPEPDDPPTFEESDDELYPLPRIKPGVRCGPR